jgi:hypothetical protein
VGGKSKAKMQVAEYRMSIHFGVCAGPIDHVSAVYIGEKEAWSGRLEDTGAVIINKPDLHGGIKKEGGAVGTMTYLPGFEDQIMPEFLAAKYGRTSDTMWAYRGIASLFFHEDLNVGGSRLGSPAGSQTWITQWLSSVWSSVSGYRGFYWSANNPYLKTIWAKVGRAARGLDTRYEKLWRNNQEFDCNPAHIIFECLMDRVWGMGSPLSAIDVASFESAAYTLYNEGFGLSLIWTRQSTIEDFVSEILDHIEATLFINPRNGLLTLKLIRDDYDPDTLPVFNPQNSVVTNFSRKHWGETINEIVVTWTNPENEQEETTTAQDLANIAMQGAPVSDGRNYYGVRSAALAQQLAQRDLRAASYPIATCDLEADRSEWDLLPGGVCKVVSPDDYVTEIIMRVGPIDYGNPGTSKIRASLAEDVFSLATAEYTIPPETEFEDPSEDPAPATAIYPFTLPYHMVVQKIDPTLSLSAEYPVVFSGVLAAQTGADTAFFELVGTAVDSVGNVTQQTLGTMTITSRASLVAGLDAEPSTTVLAFSNRTQVEFAVIKTVSEDGYELFRGVLDTIPREWPSATPVWFVTSDNVYADQDQRAAFEEVDYWVLPTTSKGTLPVSDATVQEVTLTERPWLPLRPANVFIEGQQFVPEIDATELDEINISWANRNRLLEDSQVMPWWEDSVTPEPGQITRIEVRRMNGVLVEAFDVPEGEDSYTITKADIVGAASVTITVKAVRDGLESLQNYTQVVKLSEGDGYGFHYGYNYGGI